MKDDLQKVKEIIVDVGSRPDEEIRPLLLYNGNLNEGRAKALLSFVLSMKEKEIIKLKDLVNIGKTSENLIHMEGLHRPLTIHGLYSIFSRLNTTPKVTDLYPGLHEYVNSVDDMFLYALTPISEKTHHTNVRTWRRDHVVRIRGTKTPRVYIPSVSFYPYLPRQEQVLSECELLKTVHDLVPKTFYDSLRSDICQELIIAVLGNVVTLDNLKDDSMWYIKRILKEHPNRYTDISLESPNDGNDERTFGEKSGIS